MPYMPHLSNLELNQMLIECLAKGEEKQDLMRRLHRHFSSEEVVKLTDYPQEQP
jgi:hypothetical protein